MAQVEVELWKIGNPTRVPIKAEGRLSSDGGPLPPFFIAVRIHERFFPEKRTNDPADQSAPVASASLASDHVGLASPG